MEKSFLNGIGLIEKEMSGQSCLNYANTSKVNDGHGDNNDSIVTNAKRPDANIVVPKSVLAAKIHDMERQMLDGKLVLVDNEGVPLKPMYVDQSSVKTNVEPMVDPTTKMVSYMSATSFNKEEDSNHRFYVRMPVPFIYTSRLSFEKGTGRTGGQNSRFHRLILAGSLM
ncbi:hypothetical protein Tco_0452136 [Tanacetum coccineum]